MFQIRAAAVSWVLPCNSPDTHKIVPSGDATTCRTILVDSSTTRDFTTPTWRHADDYQPVTSEKPYLSTHPNEDQNGSSSTIRTDGRGQISRPALQPESRQLPLRPRRTRRRLPADEA
jgi:hypothetical protein